MSVRVKLITRDQDLKVDESPLNVPLELKRYGLSEIVNQLLQTEEVIPFDFLVGDGELLRGSLDQYLTKTGQSSEQVITLEYVRAILPPTFLSSFEHDDWISACDIKNKQILTGCYDGVVRVFDQSGSVINQLRGHQSAVLTAKFNLSGSKVISGSRDGNVHIYNLEGNKLSAILRGHKAPVTSLTILKNEKFVSGSQDGTLNLFTTRVKELPNFSGGEDDGVHQQSTKRRKIAENTLKLAKHKAPFTTLTGHTSNVTGCVAHPTEPDAVYSCGLDHSVRTWDLVTSKCIDVKQTSFSLMAIESLGVQTQLLACGSSARHITLVDPRSSTHATVKQLNGHKNFVVSISRNPQNGFQFASASHDGTVKLWDVRSDKSMHTIQRENVETDRELYCVAWGDVLAMGGRSKELEIVTTNNERTK